MPPLAWVFAVKIAVTLLFVALPLLVGSPRRLARLVGWADPGPARTWRIWRLYGVALLALLVGYGFGLVDIMDGRVPVGILVMASVSNLGAAAFLLAAPELLLRWAGLFFGLVGGAALLGLVAPGVMIG